jgi:hypothetical protein
MSALRIALVEDNDALRITTLEILRQEGHGAVGYATAEELLAVPGNPSMDLAVVDVNLPGDNGFVLARKLRARQPGLGIIMLTARTGEKDRIASYEHGADLYLAKPASSKELLAAVRTVGRRLTASDPATNSNPISLPAWVVGLPPRLREVGALLAETSLTYKEMAGKMEVAEGTLRTHVERLYRSAGVQSRAEFSLKWRAP